MFAENTNKNDQFDNTLKDEDEDEDEDDVYIPPNVQYFSRKNSILRIPIPPRASNRMRGKSIVSFKLHLFIFSVLLKC